MAGTGSQTAYVSHLLEGDRARLDAAFPYPIAETASDVQAAFALPDLHCDKTLRPIALELADLQAQPVGQDLVGQVLSPAHVSGDRSVCTVK